MSADDLARRLVESPHWRWMPRCGGRTRDGYTVDVLSVGEDGRPCIYVVDGDRFHDCPGPDAWDALDAAPDLTDPATEGCLLRLARELYPEGVRIWTGTCPFVVVWDSREGRWRRFPGPLGEALAHAILAAGEVRDA